MAAAAVLCGNKRSFLFEEDVYPSSIHLPKRLRCSSSSTVPPQHNVTPLRRPTEETEPERFGKRTKLTHENLSNNLKGVEEWVELFVREMSSATSVDDAKSRAAKALEVFEHGIMPRAAAEVEVVAAQKEEENMLLKQEIQEMKKENMIQNERLKEYQGPKPRTRSCQLWLATAPQASSMQHFYPSKFPSSCLLMDLTDFDFSEL